MSDAAWHPTRARRDMPESLSPPPASIFRIPAHHKAHTSVHRAYPITIVTGYFELEKAPGQTQNKSPADYRAWMKNLLPVVNWPLVIFCDAQSVDFIRQLRGDKPAVYVVTRFEEFSVYQYRGLFHAESLERQPDVNINVPLVINEKPHFLRRAMAMNPFASEMFFWCDIGALRRERLCGEKGLFRLSDHIEWPNLAVCRGVASDKVALFSHHHRTHHGFGILAGFFGGAAAPLRSFCDVFYRIVEQQIENNLSILYVASVLTKTSIARPDLVRVLPLRQIRWIRWLKFGLPTRQFWWYCLNGNRFPRWYFRHEISLREIITALPSGLAFGLRGKIKRGLHRMRAPRIKRKPIRSPR